jgi:hypothetical protein
MTDVGVAALVGLAAGAHVATWGMYKDAPYEGFTYPKYLRSVILSGVIAVVVELITNLSLDAAGIVVLFGLTYVIERALVEFYKTFVRDEDQSKYFIPMQLAVGGQVVEQRTRRLAAGVTYAAIVAVLVLAIYALQEWGGGLRGVGAVLVVGSVGGWISAFGGAWKDAPHEGFQLRKFFRSPLVALGYALLLAMLTTTYVYIAMGALGYTVATLETYKTFFKPNTPRGKFAGKPIKYPEMLVRRQRFLPLYIGIWIGIVTAFVVALSQPNAGVI